MDLDIIRGSIRSTFQTNQVAEILTETADSGSLYLGYPVLSSSEGKVIADALLLTPSVGVVAFRISTVESDVITEEEIHEHQALRAALTSHFSKYPSLWVEDSLAFKITIVTVTSDLLPEESPPRGFVPISELGHFIRGLTDQEINQDLFREIESVTQSVTTLRYRPRRPEATNPESRGAALLEIEKSVSTLDRWQRRAAIETPEGPQRIRGLAGSGKTVILAWKAAYLHALNPSWTIGVTFQTRSLYDQFESLISRFCEVQTG